MISHSTNAVARTGPGDAQRALAIAGADAVPTSATNGPPMPNTSGTSRYSSRAAVPKPATAAGPAVSPTSAVIAAIVTLVCTVETPATAPTRRMSRARLQRSRASRRCTTLRPDSTYQPSTSPTPTL